MKTCGECHKEYDEEKGTCPHCDEEKMSGKAAGQEWRVVTTVANDIEYEMVAGVMGMANIPVVGQTLGVDSLMKVLLGVPMRGIEVKVPPDRYEEAVKLLNSDYAEEEMPQEPQDL